MTKTQKIWTILCLFIIIISEIFIGGIATTFLKFSSVFGSSISAIYQNSPIVAILFTLPEAIALYVLIVLSQKYNYKNQVIKYFVLSFLIIIFVIFVSLIYVVYRFSFASFP